MAVASTGPGSTGPRGGRPTRAGAPAPDADFIALYAVTCEARGDAPLALDVAMLAAIRTRLADLTARWLAVPVGGTLVLSLPEQRASTRPPTSV